MLTSNSASIGAGGRAARRCYRRPGFGQLVFAGCALALGVVGAGVAQDGVQPDLIAMSLEELMQVEVDSVVGASLFRQKVTEAPASVTVVTAADIRRLGYRTLAEVLAGVRGMYTWHDQNYEHLGIRGFGRLGDYNSDILLLIDGHPTNESVYYSSAIGWDFLIDLDLIDRVEIVRGPSSSLYGTSAFFGVINVITRDGGEVAGAEAAGGLASHQTWEGRLGYGQRFSNGLELLASGTLYRSDGQDLYFPEYDDPTTNNGWAVDCDDEQAEQLFLKLRFGDVELLAAHADREKTVPTGAWETVFNDPGTMTGDQHDTLGLSFADVLASGLEIAAHLQYSRYAYDGTYVYDESEGGEPELVRNLDVTRAQWVIGEAHIARQIKKHRLLAGVEVRRDLEVLQLNQDEDGEIYLDDDRDGWVWGVFAQDEMEVAHSLRLSLGVRYDQYTSFGGTTNPRLGVIYQPRQRTSLKLLYGQAFRAPSAYELYYQSGDAQKANPELSPETIGSGEVVWEEFIGRGLQTSVSVYTYRVDGLIGQVTDPSDGLAVFENVDEVTASGIELEVQGRWWRQIEGYASWSIQETEDAAVDESYPNSPRRLGAVRLSVPFSGERLWVSPELLYRGSVETLDNQTLDSAFVANLTILATEVLKGVDLSLTVRNLFDESYRVPGGQEHLQDSLEQDGRTVRARAVVRF